MTAGSEELVVLLDEEGHRIGTAPKRGVHHQHTPLHLAFSCYLFDDAGRLLVTRRALDKPTWPGVWTNSFCGHPAPGEDLADAVRRRGSQELGVAPVRVQLALPGFRYQAQMPDGTRENEMCPVYIAALGPGTGPESLRPEPEEVVAVAWVEWGRFADEVLSGVREVSPWCRQQVGQLADLQRSSSPWPEAPEGLGAGLPPAARHPRRPGPEGLVRPGGEGGGSPT